MAAPVSVRLAEAGDLSRVYEIERELFAHGSYPYFFFRQALDALPGFFLVALAGSETAGYALGSLQAGDDHGWILSVGVDARHQGRGIGRALTAALVNRFEVRGANAAFLHVSPANTGAVALYTALGFETVRSGQDYFGPGEHRLIMRRAAAAT